MRTCKLKIISNMHKTKDMQVHGYAIERLSLQSGKLQESLVQHVLRVNFQMAIWRHADTPVIQIPNATDGHGWTLDDDGVPLWYEGNCLPNILIEDGRIMDEEESDSEEQEVIEPTVYESDADDDY